VNDSRQHIKRLVRLNTAKTGNRQKQNVVEFAAIVLLDGVNDVYSVYGPPGTGLKIQTNDYLRLKW